MTSEEYDALTDEQKRIKVAELCGWTRDTTRANTEGENPWNHPEQVDPPLGCYTAWDACELPDYLNDLNTMHEQWKSLDGTQMADFAHHLCAVVGVKSYFIPTDADMNKLIRATAAQRAKAFVLTMTGE